MIAIVPWLMSLIGPITTRILLVLGLGVVSYAGSSALISIAQTQIAASFGGLPSDISALVFMSGIPQGMGIILSALAARAGFSQVSKIQRL